MAFSDRMKKLGQKLINKYGNDVIYVIRENCSYDPSVGENVCTEVKSQIKATFTNFSIDELAGDNVQAEDILILVAEDVHFLASDRLEAVGIPNIRFTVIDTQNVTVQNLTVVQRIHLRRVAAQ